MSVAYESTTQTMFTDPWERKGAADQQQQLDPSTTTSTSAAAHGTRHSSVLDSVHSTNFMFAPASSDDPYHAYYPTRLPSSSTSNNATPGSGGELYPFQQHQHQRQQPHMFDSYTSAASPKPLDAVVAPPPHVALAGLHSHMASYAAKSSSDGRPVYSPYSALASTSSSSTAAGPSTTIGSSDAYAAFNLPPLPSSMHQLPTSRSAPSSSTIGELLNSIPRNDHFDPTQAGIPSIPRPPSGSSNLITVKPFTRKLFDMLVNPELKDLLYWDEPGRAIVICSGHPKFKSQVLQPAFGHSSVQSFHRQLNVYRFKRVDIHSLLVRTLPRCECSAWAHPDFFREGERNLYKLQPRPSKARRLKKERQEQERHRKNSDERRRSYEQAAAYDSLNSLSPDDYAELPSPEMYAPQAGGDHLAHSVSLMAAGLVTPASLLSNNA